jgi:ribonuclease HI
MKARAWVDGAVSNNGNKNGSGQAYGGIGVVVVANPNVRSTSSRSFHGPADAAAPGAVTNNRMELEAVLEAMRMRVASEIDCNALEVYSDSAYVVNGYNTHMARWIKRNWRTAEGGPVKNQDLWKHMISLGAKLVKLDCTFKLLKVAGHAGDANNEEADRLATDASARIKASREKRDNHARGQAEVDEGSRRG